MEWSELVAMVLFPFALVGVVELARGWRDEGFWWVARSRYQSLASEFLLCREREAYVWHLLAEAEAGHKDQSLHWWAWWELYRLLEVPRERREHERTATDPDPGSALLPIVGPFATPRDPGSAGGGRFDFPL